MTDVDWKLLVAQQQPGPGYYDVDNPSLRHQQPVSKFTSRGKTDLDVKILSASQVCFCY